MANPVHPLLFSNPVDPSSSSSQPSGTFTYDVFLSFRGTDTRKNFTDHLYAALVRKGIHTFRDDEELQRGESIGPSLLKAIEESRYVVVVFSPNYADSAWCLNEIAKVSDCMNEIGQKVLPVFYHIDPSAVGKQTGEHFGKAFEKHQNRYEAEPHKVERWKNALSKVGKISGWHLQHEHESKVIEEIVQKIFTELNQLNCNFEGLVGIDSHLNEFLSYLDVGGTDVRIIGICGMCGIGKSTMAQVVSKLVKAQFEGDSFLENVREVTEKKQGVVQLQEQLLSNLLKTEKSDVRVQSRGHGKDIIRQRLRSKRLLLVIDDVDQVEQLEALCDRTWFGPGSRIILTSRDEQVLIGFGVDKLYKVDPLNDSDALELFLKKAFTEGQLIGGDFLELSKEFLKYADGHPLAIEILASSVKRRGKGLWVSTLDRLKKSPGNKIFNLLKVSFDGLEETEKEKFLDIACFFERDFIPIEHLARILQGNEGPDIDIKVLLEKSLVTLFGKRLRMHDLLKEFAFEIVRRECCQEPGERSRLWLAKEIIRVLDLGKATRAVQSIMLDCPTEDAVVNSTDNAFSNMERLRLLKIRNVKFTGNISYLSNQLQYLEWEQCPLESFPPDFQPGELVEVHMLCSRIKQLWVGKKGWGALRILDLTGSLFLMSTPDFTDVPYLEKLLLMCCISLAEIHPSLGCLKKLLILDFSYCKSIESLPPFVTLEGLYILKLSQCSGLKKFPEIEGNMKMLKELHLDGTSLEELPSSIEHFTGLTLLDLKECKNLLHLPDTIGGLTSLKCLDLEGCSKLDKIPETLNDIEFLQKILIGGTSVSDLSIIGGMKNLQFLSCRRCKYLVSEACKELAALSSLTVLDLSDCNLMDGEFLNEFSSMISLMLLDLSGNTFVWLPESLSHFTELRTLHLRNCKQLQLLPTELPSSLQCVWANDCTSLTDYPNQIKELDSRRSGVTTINTLHYSNSPQDISGFSRKSILEGGFMKVVSTHHHVDGKIVEHRAFNPSPTYFEEQMPFLPGFSHISPRDNIPKWFSSRSTKNPTSILIPSHLADDNNWNGFVACVVFSVKGYSGRLSLFERPNNEYPHYSYKVTWETDSGCLESNLLELNEVDEYEQFILTSSHQRLMFYISSSKFKERRRLNFSSELRVKFETTDPSMVFQKCGIGLAYGTEWFSSMTRHDCVDHESVCPNKLGGEGSVPQPALWLKRSQPMEWEICVPSVEDESIQALRENIESVLPRYIEGLHHQCKTFEFNLSGSPGWFDLFAYPANDMPLIATMPFEIPPILKNFKKWMGMAIMVSLVEKVGRIEDIYWVSIQLGLREMSRKLMQTSPPSEERHQLLVGYLPRAMIPEISGKASTSQTLSTVGLFSMYTDNPHVKVRICGLRIVCQEDIQGLADTVLQCIQREGSFRAWDSWLEERMADRYSKTPGEMHFDLRLQKYRNVDWCDPGRPLSRRFVGAKLLQSEWFKPFIKHENFPVIELPPNLFEDDNWLGFVACSWLFNDQYYPNTDLASTSSSSSTSAPDPDEDVKLFYLLDSDCVLAGNSYIDMTEDIKYRRLCEYKVSFIYIPRKLVRNCWRQCKMAWVQSYSSSPFIEVESCALGLLYKNDIEDLVETLTLAELGEEQLTPWNYLYCPID